MGQGVVIASVIDDPDIGDDEVFNASSAVSVNDVVHDQGRRGIRAGRRVGSVAEVHDDAVAVSYDCVEAIIGAGNDVVGNDVVESGIGVVPLGTVEGYSACPPHLYPLW